MAASASTVAAATMSMAALSLHRLSKSSFRTLPRLTCSLSSSSSPSKFNISFAPPKPKPEPNPGPQTEPDEEDAGQFLIPWIVRGEDGNLKLQTQPPARLLNAIANAETGSKKKKGEREDKVRAASPPQRSKAARRFYNENFRDSGTRLSKVLAASGGKS